MCGAPADAKVEETIFHDDPMPIRHALTAYVCAKHFTAIMSPRRGSSQQDEERMERLAIEELIQAIWLAFAAEGLFRATIPQAEAIAARLRPLLRASLLRSSGRPSTPDSERPIAALVECASPEYIPYNGYGPASERCRGCGAEAFEVRGEKVEEISHAPDCCWIRGVALLRSTEGAGA